MIELNNKAIELISDCEKLCLNKFNEIDDIEFHNQLKVLNAFNKNEIQAYHFIGSSGYGQFLRQICL